MKGTWRSGKNNSKGHKGIRETHVDIICTNMEKLDERTRKGTSSLGTLGNFDSSVGFTATAFFFFFSTLELA